MRLTSDAGGAGMSSAAGAAEPKRSVEAAAIPESMRFIARIYRNSGGRGAWPSQRRTGNTGNRG
jgi:hypothetical protein